jgi:hypothetical protein
MSKGPDLLLAALENGGAERLFASRPRGHPRPVRSLPSA